MAAAFRPVNSSEVPDHTRSNSATTAASSPPIRTVAPSPNPISATAFSFFAVNTVVLTNLNPSQSSTMADDATTPTRATFSSSGNSLAGQKPLPTSPFPQAVQIPRDAKSVPKRVNSQHSQKSKDSEDVEMEESEGDGQNKDENEGSDHESENADNKSNGKKKKSQRFYCTDYPPCTLSFTRSEHLARHIRKHTGERPFQCHCSRRFSRLDNLRQHAQTVHVNEDIPIDSLAATGARFQRQTMRPERVRQPTGRARASTAGSASSIARSHSKSLSTSSINNISSPMNTRDRPPPLVMADPRGKIPLDSYSGRDGGYPQYRPVSPSEYSTPTSATFSTGQNSPRWSGFASPTSSHSRSHSMYADPGTPSRRLSIPAGNNPFQSPITANVGRPSFPSSGLNTSNAGAYSPANSSLLSSPTLPGTGYSRRESMSSSTDESWRRRTWHPDSQNFHPTRLSNVSTPGQYDVSHNPPLAEPNNRSSSIRLPGIESFDSVRRPLTPPKRNPSPMVLDPDPSNLPRLPPLADERRGPVQWDHSLNRGINKLEITPTLSSMLPNNTPPQDNAHTWAHEANQAVQAQAEQARHNPPTVRFNTATPSYSAGNAPVGPRPTHQHTMSMPNISARDHRRRGWYNGPLQPHAEETRATRIERMVHPNINEFPVFPSREPRPTLPQNGNERSQNSERLRGLDALVAVATSEGNTAAAY